MKQSLMKQSLDKLEIPDIVKFTHLTSLKIVSMTHFNQVILDYIAAHPGARREDIGRQTDRYLLFLAQIQK